MGARGISRHGYSIRVARELQSLADPLADAQSVFILMLQRRLFEICAVLATDQAALLSIIQLCVDLPREGCEILCEYIFCIVMVSFVLQIVPLKSVRTKLSNCPFLSTIRTNAYLESYSPDAFAVSLASTFGPNGKHLAERDNCLHKCLNSWPRMSIMDLHIRRLQLTLINPREHFFGKNL